MRTSPLPLARLGSYVPLAAACLFVVLMATSHFSPKLFHLNKDEGYNWMKSRLVADGYELYDEIWSDQPPGFTWVLAGWCQAVGWEVSKARLLALMWSGVLIFALADILRRERGATAAALGILALLCSQRFLQLSGAVLIGTPSIALALLSVWALSRWRTSQSIGWVATASVLLGLSLAFKLFTAILIPIIVVWLWIYGAASASRRWQPPVAFCTGLIVVLGGVWIVVGDVMPALRQILGTHLTAHALIGQKAGIKVVPRIIWYDKPLFLLAFLGLITVWFKDLRRPSAFSLCGTWLAAACLALVCHRPVWSHHALLITVPAAVLAGAAVRREMRRSLMVVIAVLAVFVGIMGLRHDRLRWSPPDETAYWQIVSEMARFRDESRWVVVGTPLFAAHLDLRTPPELAVSSIKRFKTDRLDAGVIDRIIERDRPEQILLTPDWPDQVRKRIGHQIIAEYRRIAPNPAMDFELYVRRDLSPGESEPRILASNLVNMSDDWFATEQGHDLIENLVSWQGRLGGWAKGYDASRPRQEIVPSGAAYGPGSFDNGLTCTEIRVLARAFRLTARPDLMRAVVSGLDFVVNAAYPNGGWPQRYPPPSNYSRAITLNDEAMINILNLLRDVWSDEEFAFIDPERRRQAQKAFDRGLDCLLRCQIEVEGTLTAWPQQVDPETLQPVRGRVYEPPAIAGRESARILDFLLSLDAPSPDVRRAIHSAAAWFQASQISDWRIERTPADVVLIEDSDAAPLWARLYDIPTNRPIYCGRDGVIRDSLSEIEVERRVGYEWIGPWATEVLERYHEWAHRNQPP